MSRKFDEASVDDHWLVRLYIDDELVGEAHPVEGNVQFFIEHSVPLASCLGDESIISITWHHKKEDDGNTPAGKEKALPLQGQ